MRPVTPPTPSAEVCALADPVECALGAGRRRRRRLQASWRRRPRFALASAAIPIRCASWRRSGPRRARYRIPLGKRPSHADAELPERARSRPCRSGENAMPSDCASAGMSPPRQRCSWREASTAAVRPRVEGVQRSVLLGAQGSRPVDSLRGGREADLNLLEPNPVSLSVERPRLSRTGQLLRGLRPSEPFGPSQVTVNARVRSGPMRTGPDHVRNLL
jgi:hypothetical protein